MASMTSEPAVSVVVATRDRRALLGRLVEALARQEDAPSYDVVIVDDGSGDGTWEELERLAMNSRVPLVPVRLEANRGPATARNAGWRQARAPVVVFTDDDCIPQPGWIAALAAGLEDADVVQGRTVPDPDQVDRRPFSYTITVEGEWGYYEACNIAYRRDLLERLDGFDETFRYNGSAPRGAGPIYGEDVDLAWRARAADARVVFEPDALVLHDVRQRSFLDHLRDLRRWEGIAMAMARNPRLRDRCHWRWFWVRSHPWALLAAAGLALAGTSRSRAGRLSGAAMVVPYIGFRTRFVPVGRRRHWAATIPLAFLTDLLEIGVFARASLRYRTLVL